MLSETRQPLTVTGLRNTLIQSSPTCGQGVVDGPVYMVQALEAQLVGEGYN